jgi:hypothetical protein
MIRRDSQELGIAGDGMLGAIAPYQGTADNPTNDPVEPMDDDTGILLGLLKIGENIAKREFGQEAEEAYLEGQLARQQGVAIEDVETSPVLRSFVHGGYNDQNYRIAQVESERDYNEWLKTEGRTLAPSDTKVREAILRASNKTLGAMGEGMSNRGRLDALASQTKTQEAMVTKQADAYKKYVVEAAAARVLPQGNQIITDLSDAMLKNDHATYSAVTDKAALYYRDLSNNPDLPPELKATIGTNFLNAMINADQRLPVEQMRELGMLDNLPFDKREEIDIALRKSESRTVVRDMGDRIAYNALFEQSAINGGKSIPETLAFIQQGYRDKTMTYDHALSLFKQVTKGAADKELSLKLLRAINQRNISGDEGIHTLGSTVPEAMKLLDENLREAKATATERVATMVSVGMDFGYLPPEYGQTLGQAVRAVGAASPDQPASAEFTEVLNTVTSLVDTANKIAPYKSSILLQSMPEDTRGAMAYVIDQAQYGNVPSDSLRRYWANVDNFKKLDVIDRARQTDKWYKEHQDTITSGRGFNTSWWANLFGGSQFDDSIYSQNAILDNVWEELRSIDTREENWGMDEASKVSLATAQVRARTVPVPTEVGSGVVRPLVFDKTVSVENLFGTNDTNRVGLVLSEMYPASKDGLQSVFAWDRVNKVLLNRQLDETGNIVAQDIVPTASVKSVIQDQQNQVLDRKIGTSFGTPRKVGDGLIVIDGRNSVGVGPTAAWMTRDLITKAIPDKVNELVKANPAAAQSVFRDATDLAMSESVRSIAPLYTVPAAQSAIAAAVYVEGPDAMAKIIKAAEKALDAGDTAAYERAINNVGNPVIREELKKQLPSGRNNSPQY